MALSHFLKLKPEKQDTIIQAAMDEFVEYGYDMASTNRIVERAGIAKGTLFKYFSSKEELFIYVCDKVADEIRPGIYSLDEKEPEGLFETLKYITIKKAALRYRFPKEYALILLMVSNVNHPVYRKLLDKYTGQSFEFYNRLIQKVDLSVLRPGISPEEAFRLVGWTLRGMEDYILERTKTIPYSLEYEQKLYEDFDRMCELLKYGLYKPKSEEATSPIPQPAEAAKIVPEPEAVAVLQ